VAVAPELRNLDPHSQLHGGYAMLCNVYEGLVALDARMAVVPGLAERWENPDELTWRFFLRPGVIFHDGRPLTAEDVVASLERAREQGRDSAAYLSMLQEIRSPGKGVVELHTARPYPTLLNNVALVFIAPRGARQLETQAVGTGPYRVLGFDPAAGFTLAAFDRYWRGAPSEGRVTFVFEREPAGRLEALEQGRAEIGLRLPESAAEPGSGFRLIDQAAPGARLLGLRLDRPPFSDPRVRQAVDLAVDREAATSDLLHARARPLGQLLPQGIYGHVPDLPPHARDLARARRLLEKAGGGRAVAVRLIHGAGRRAEAELIAAQLREAGFRIELQTVDVPELIPQFEADGADALLWSYLYYTGDAGDLFENVLHSKDPRGFGTQNFYRYRNTEVDALVERGGRSSTLAERQESYQRAMRLAMADLPVVPLWEVPWVSGVRDGIAWTPRAHGWFHAADVRRP
jgi:peptide/nickel transport system substrate-binding protein